MKTSFFLSAALLLAASGASAAVAPYDAQAALTAVRADLGNWMSYLPDDMFVAHVSIPGTHDTATAEGWVSSTGPSYSTTQSATIDEQLNGGIRAFDFRPGLKDGKLWCNHGTDQTKLTMEDAMRKLTTYLDAHQKEFFVIHLFRGNIYRTGEVGSASFLGGSDSAEDQATYNSLFNQLFNEGEFADYIIDWNPRLKVSDIRGKIVIFRRDRIDFAHIAKGGNLTGWPSDKDAWNSTVYAMATNATDPGISGIIQVTDISSPKDETTLNTELSSLTNLFNYTATQTRPNDVENPATYKPFWSMIFTSGAYPSENTKGYLTNATYTNPHFTSLVADATQKGPSGIVFSDWVLTDNHTYSGSDYAVKGIDLVPTIIENNFAYASEFIIDDELFADDGEVKESEFENREYFLRNIATGEFLCAGTTWGTHATIGPIGLRITPVYDSLTDIYTLKTTCGGWIGIDPGVEYYVDYGTAAQFTLEKLGNGIYTLVGDVDGTRKAMTVEKIENSMFVDGSVYFVLPRDYVEGSAMQQWEFLTEEDLLEIAKNKATYEKGADVSFMIHGNSFAVNDTENNKWVLSGNGSFAKKEISGTDAWMDKDFVLRMYATFALANYNKFVLSQTVTGLPAGKYSFSCNLATSTDEIPLTVGGQTVDIASAVTGDAALTSAGALDLFRGADKDKYTVRLDNIQVGDEGSLEIKLDNAAGIASKYSVCLDNFRLMYYGDGTFTSVNSVEVEDAVVDVYTLDGMVIRRGVANAEALDNLPAGLYILKGENTVRKVIRN